MPNVIDVTEDCSENNRSADGPLDVGKPVKPKEFAAGWNDLCEDHEQGKAMDYKDIIVDGDEKGKFNPLSSSPVAHIAPSIKISEISSTTNQLMNEDDKAKFIGSLVDTLIGNAVLSKDFDDITNNQMDQNKCENMNEDDKAKFIGSLVDTLVRNAVLSKDFDDATNDQMVENKCENVEFMYPEPVPCKSVPVKQPCILVLDSLTGKKCRQARLVATVRDFLTKEFEEKYGSVREFSNKTIPGAAPKVPEQPNNNDCGIFLCLNFEHLFLSPISDYTLPIDSLSHWFPNSEADSRRKRNEYAEIIRKLATEQRSKKRAGDKIKATSVSKKSRVYPGDLNSNCIELNKLQAESQRVQQAPRVKRVRFSDEKAGSEKKSSNDLSKCASRMAETIEVTVNKFEGNNRSVMMKLGVNSLSKNSFKFTLKEVRGDLFSAPRKESLCHCISKDYKLGMGIAKTFRDKFGRIDELKASGAVVGGLAVLQDGSRYLYNLITKEKFNQKPSIKTLRKSLEAMRVHCLAHGVKSISMPRIGCGGDGMSWSTVRKLIEDVFQLEAVQITVYHLGNCSQHKNQLFTGAVFDSHCHLDLVYRRRKGEEQDFVQSMNQCLGLNGGDLGSSFGGCVTNVCNPSDWGQGPTGRAVSRVISDLTKDSKVFVAIGCHPRYADRMQGNRKDQLTMLVSGRSEYLRKKVVALGECGLDYSRKNKISKNLQKKVFTEQLKIALKFQLPLVLHIRDAEGDGYDVLTAAGVPRDWPIHRHCFTGGLREAWTWLDRYSRSKIGVTGLVTYKGKDKAREVREVVKSVPLNRILLETDAPYFPMADRSPCTLPGDVIHVAAEVAAIKGVQLRTVLEQNLKNVYDIYKVGTFGDGGL